MVSDNGEYCVPVLKTKDKSDEIQDYWISTEIQDYWIKVSLLTRVVFSVVTKVT